MRFVGVLSNRWRLLHKPIIASHENATNMVKAMCVLHNLLKSREPAQYIPQGLVDNAHEQNGQ